MARSYQPVQPASRRNVRPDRTYLDVMGTQGLVRRAAADDQGRDPSRPRAVEHASAESGNRKIVPFSEPVAGRTAAEDRLNSWKEIAAYLKRGTRTAQRWNREQGLPVHRLQHDRLGSVYAYRSELDAWWAGRSTETKPDTGPQPVSQPSVAVLPFSDMSQEQDQGYFCDGIAEEIVFALNRIEGLRVSSRSSSFQYRGEKAGSREIGRQLRVKTLLEGSVRRSGERLRICVQLTDAENGFHLWSAQYDRALEDVFAIQEDVAQSVVRELAVTLTPKECIALQTPPTGDLRAFDCYLRGRSFYYRYSPRDVRFALDMFQRAAAIDPGFAQAYAGLADCWSYLYLYSDRSPLVLEQAQLASAKAVEMDPNSAQAQASHGLSLSLSGKDDEAERAFRSATRLDPGLFEAHYFHARHCFAKGRLEEAISSYERAIEARPQDFQSPLLVAQSYDALGRPGEAQAARRRGIEAAQRHLELNPDDARAVYMAANGFAGLGDASSARAWADRALAMSPTDPMLLYNVGCIYSMLGAIEPAIDCLEGAVQRGLTQKGWYEHDNNLDPVRDHPRFARLLRSLG